MAERTRSQIQTVQMSYFCRVAVAPLERGREAQSLRRSCECPGESAEVTRACVREAPWMPPGCPKVDPGHAGETMSLGWPGSISAISGWCPCDLVPDKVEEDETRQDKARLVISLY